MRRAQAPDPLHSSDDETFEVRCPVCKQVVKVALRDAERNGRVACPKGHDVPLVKAF